METRHYAYKSLKYRLAMTVTASAFGIALTLPVSAQQQPRAPVDESPMTRSAPAASAATPPDSSPASAGSSATAVQRSEEPIHHGANPANLLCDSQQGQSRERCLMALSAGGGLQQGAGDGD